MILLGCSFPSESRSKAKLDVGPRNENDPVVGVQVPADRMRNQSLTQPDAPGAPSHWHPVAVPTSGLVVRRLKAFTEG